MSKRRKKNKKNKKNQANRINQNKKTQGGHMENKKSTTIKTVKTTTEPWWKKTYRAITPSYTKPEMGVDERHLNIVLFKNEDLKEIVEKCLPEAGGNEFQFHYIAAQIKGYKDEKEFIVTIPLLYFNFNQEVSSAHVDFDLAEIKELVEKYRPAAEKLFNAQWKTIFKPIYDFISKISDETKIIIDEIGSVHRHPGDFSFSATDLKYDPNKPGVVYRTLEAHDYAQVDSVIYIYHNHNDFKLVTTQTRLFNTTAVDSNDESKGATGSIDEVPTIEIIVGKESTESFEVQKTLTSLINQFLGKEEKTESKDKNYTIKGFRCKIDEVPNFIEQLFIPKIGELKTLKVIDPKLIKAQRWGYGYGYGYGYNKKDDYWDKYYYGVDEKDETGVIDDNIVIDLEDANSNEYLLTATETDNTDDDTDEFEVDMGDFIEKYRYNPKTYQYELIEKISKKS
ncbi:MAG: hypothetical protein GXO49_05860 [Chlorobi bacterium]|nr:hypothetical protein [Chlorobiota bacterium]